MTFTVSDNRPTVLSRAAAAVLSAWRSTSLTRVISLAVFASIIVFVVLTFRDYGISNDEPVQHTYGQLLWAWYQSGFTDDRVFHYINLYLYGGLFDLIAAGLADHVALPVYELRHLISASFGVMGLFGVWRLGKLLGGEKAGIIATVLLAFTGMYGGAMFTHTKDVPFAATMVWSLYFITRVAVALPALPSWRVVAGLGFAIGCAFGLRVGGVFAVLYLGVTMVAGAIAFADWRLFLRLVVRILPAGILAYAIMAVTWPWSVLPPTNLFQAMGAFSNFSFDLHTLINGQELPIEQVPATYMSEYLLIKLPEITLFGILAAVPFAFASLLRAPRGRRRRWIAYLPLALSLLVPIVFTLVDRPPLYNGIRHFLFVLPSATLVAALGLASLWRWSQRRSAVLGFSVAMVASALFMINAVSFVRLHPYEYVGYNQLVGGAAGANGRFEGDYWSATLREATLNLREGVEMEANPPAKPYLVAVCAETEQVEPYLGTKLKVTEDWEQADFMLTALNVGCNDVVPGMTYRTISRGGVPLAMVVDMRARHTPLYEPLPWDDDNDKDTPAVSFNGPGSVTVAKKEP